HELSDVLAAGVRGQPVGRDQRGADPDAPLGQLRAARPAPPGRQGAVGPGMSRCLPPTFYRRDPVAVARDLLGQRLVRVLDGNRHSGIIVETEAYLGLIDKAAHAYRGKTRRNASMWLAGGHAYVYFIYGMHQCMNVVAGQAD